MRLRGARGRGEPTRRLAPIPHQCPVAAARTLTASHTGGVSSKTMAILIFFPAAIVRVKCHAALRGFVERDRAEVGDLPVGREPAGMACGVRMQGRGPRDPKPPRPAARWSSLFTPTWFAAISFVDRWSSSGSRRSEPAGRAAAPTSLPRPARARRWSRQDVRTGSISAQRASDRSLGQGPCGSHVCEAADRGRPRQRSKGGARGRAGCRQEQPERNDPQASRTHRLSHQAQRPRRCRTPETTPTRPRPDQTLSWREPHRGLKVAETVTGSVADESASIAHREADDAEGQG